MRILPVDQRWAHTYLLAPYLQGCEMVNRAWSGIDFQPLAPKPLPLKERVVSWLVGTALMIPIINLIIWIAWQTFGSPIELFDLLKQSRSQREPSNLRSSWTIAKQPAGGTSKPVGA